MRVKYYFPIVTWSILLVFILYQFVFSSASVLAETESTVSTIAGIEITEKKASEIQTQITSQIVAWKEQELVVQGDTAELTIPTDLFQFDVKKTVDDFLSLTSSPWYKVWGKSPIVHIPIEVTMQEEISDVLKEAPFFYIEETLVAIKEHAGYLKTSQIIPSEVAVSKDRMDRISFDIAEVVVDGIGITSILEGLDETIILPGEKFSFISVLKETQGGYSAETVDFIASVLYSSVLRTDVTIHERHSQNKWPAYLQPGIEVKVNASGNEDFAFINEGESPLLIAASVQNQQLKIELYSFATAYEMSYSVKKEEVKPRTIYRLSPNLAAGKERVVTEGTNGLRVNVFKKTVETSGSYENEQQISRDFYPPKNKVIEVSSMPAPVIVENPTPNPNEKGESTGNSSEKSPENVEKTPAETLVDKLKEIDPEDIIYDKGGNIIGIDRQ